MGGNDACWCFETGSQECPSSPVQGASFLKMKGLVQFLDLFARLEISRFIWNFYRFSWEGKGRAPRNEYMLQQVWQRDWICWSQNKELCCWFTTVCTRNNQSIVQNAKTTLSPIVMEVENDYYTWKVTTMGDTPTFHFYDSGRKCNTYFTVLKSTTSHFRLNPPSPWLLTITSALHNLSRLVLWWSCPETLFFSQIII